MDNEEIDEIIQAKIKYANEHHAEWAAKRDVIEDKAYIIAEALGYPQSPFFHAIMSDDNLQNAVLNCDIDYVKQQAMQFDGLTDSELIFPRLELRNQIFKGFEVEAGLISGKIEDLGID